MTKRTQAYYAALAPDFDGLAHNGPAAVEAAARGIVRALRLEREDLMVDLCCGTGVFSREIVRQRPLRYQIVAVDASQAMLDRLRAHADGAIRPVCMEASSFCQFPVRYDKILIKDAVKEIADPGALFRQIRGRLAPGGRLLVVETAPDSHAPLFKEARRRWESLAPRSEELAPLVERAGFKVAKGTLRVPQRLAKDDFLEMVQKRYVPILTSFDDDELRAGIDEIYERTADLDWIELPHRFDVVIGQAG